MGPPHPVHGPYRKVAAKPATQASDTEIKLHQKGNDKVSIEGVAANLHYKHSNLRRCRMGDWIGGRTVQRSSPHKSPGFVLWLIPSPSRFMGPKIIEGTYDRRHPSYVIQNASLRMRFKFCAP